MDSSNKRSCLFVEVMFVAFVAVTVVVVAAVALTFAVVIAAVVVDDYEH